MFVYCWRVSCEDENVPVLKNYSFSIRNSRKKTQAVDCLFNICYVQCVKDKLPSGSEVKFFVEKSVIVIMLLYKAKVLILYMYSLIGGMVMYQINSIIVVSWFFLQPRYVVNRVTAGDYDCPRKVMKFLTDLHAAFRMLNLRNDFLRKKFDGKICYLPLFVLLRYGSNAE